MVKSFEAPSPYCLFLVSCKVKLSIHLTLFTKSKTFIFLMCIVPESSLRKTIFLIFCSWAKNCYCFIVTFVTTNLMYTFSVSFALLLDNIIEFMWKWFYINIMQILHHWLILPTILLEFATDWLNSHILIGTNWLTSVMTKLLNVFHNS